MSNGLYPSILYLQDGTLYKGWSFFKIPPNFGEIVFNTAMTGYQEVFSDPSYAGQMVVFTYPEIGNTGLNKQDNESNFIHIKALVSRNISSISSNWRSRIALKDYIIHKQIPHIFGLDTRSLTKRIRLFGVMNAILFDADSSNNFRKKNLNLIILNQIDLIRKITVKTIYSVNKVVVKSSSSFYHILNQSPKINNVSKKYIIVVIDLGVKFNILRKLLSLNCNICIVPATCSYHDIIQHRPDGILFSNGPGNPLLATYTIDTAKKLIKFSNIPLFGICMGHQILNVALGGQTFKLKFGHRGLNHPSGINKYSEITSQNHGFAVKKSSLIFQELFSTSSVKFLNLNDSTISATFHEKIPIFSVQYHPEASPGPHDSYYLFEVFIQLLDLFKNKK
uniref:Carbamoyl phosphate synthase small chain n=1 Tax=Pleurostichidium falkenbergii TaxID=121064 RepID=A0A4D6UXE3_9FLOR|nr:Carbamoyl phosphate synthase small subunit [Pleurostichidium falkenbergii]QCH39576.1 Carbamoyl phosphate synthase small subunit [Pleurostichidium falkenbergii]